jgi:hypothetical protein
MAWVTTPASKSLFAEFNEAFPDRDKGSDGTVGDLAHQESVSDHNPDETGNTGGKSDADNINEVHAADVDDDLRRSGWTMERCVQLILARCRSGVEKRLDYIIFNRRIWRRSNGWVQEEYTGSNPHDKHAHFSFRYGSGSGTSNPENITSGWGILAAIEAEDDMTTKAEFIEWMNDPQVQQALGRATLNGGEMKDLFETPEFQAVLSKAVQKALMERVAMVIPRLAERGWGGSAGMSARQLLEYVFEGVVASGPADIDDDGQAEEDESGSVQGMLRELLDRVPRNEAASS